MIDTKRQMSAAVAVYDRNWNEVVRAGSVSGLAVKLFNLCGKQSLSRHLPGIGDVHRDATWTFHPFTGDPAIDVPAVRFVVRKVGGGFVPAEELLSEYGALLDAEYERDRKAMGWTRYRLPDALNPGDPVPGTGKWMRYGRYFRRPSTLAEKSRNEADTALAREVAEVIGVRLRGVRRRRRLLPTSWDDIPRGDWNRKNWKRHRRTRWK